MAKSNLPIEVHDHFSKANMLHTYVQKDLGEATKHALETGKELLLAKSAIPHGRWEDECGRLFNGSLRTAQFYMQFAKNMMALPKAQSSSLLFLEGTLESAAKAARAAARGNDAPKLEGPPQPEPEVLEEPEPEYDASEDFDDSDSPESDGEVAVDTKTATGNGKKPDKPPKKYDRAFWYKQWQQSIGPLCRLVDKIAHDLGESKCQSQTVVQDHLNVATEEMMEWLGVKR